MIARVPEELMDEVDRLVAAGEYDTRSEFVREAIAKLIDRHRRDEIDRQIVDAYTRMPLTEEEFDWSGTELAREIDARRKRRGDADPG